MVSDAQQKPAPCKRFANLVLDASIIAAALKFFGMETTEDTPTKHSISPELATGLKGAESRNSGKLGNYKMPVKLRET